MVFFLVMVNTTIAAQFNYFFMSIYLLEVCLSTFKNSLDQHPQICVSLMLLATVPLSVYTLMGMSKFHRNVRIDHLQNYRNKSLQIRLSASSVIIHLALAILARFVLLYYQINRMPMRCQLSKRNLTMRLFLVTDFVFLTANLVRESVAGWSIAMYDLLFVFFHVLI